MPSYCHSMPLPCSSNASEWIDAAKNSDVDFKPFHLRHQETLQTHSHRNRCLQNHHLQELMVTKYFFVFLNSGIESFNLYSDLRVKLIIYIVKDLLANLVG